MALVRAEDEHTLLNEISRLCVESGGYLMAWVGYAEYDDARTVKPVALWLRKWLSRRYHYFPGRQCIWQRPGRFCDQKRFADDNSECIDGRQNAAMAFSSDAARLSV
jgi:hypothetical protein